MPTAATTMWSLNTVKTYLPVTVATHDDLLSKIADGVSALLEEHTGFVFVTRTRTDILDGDGGRELWLRKIPVVTLTSITVLRNPTDVAAETVLAADYRVNTETGRIVMHGDRFTAGVANVTVVYDVGQGVQDSATLPRDYYQGGLDLVKAIADEKLAGATAATSISIGPQTFMVKPDWPKHVKALVSRRRAEI